MTDVCSRCQTKYPVIGDVRGRGAMLAHRAREARHDGARCGAGRDGSVPGCHQEGVLTLTCGTYGNVLRFLPPLVMPDHLLDEALDVLDKVATGLV